MATKNKIGHNEYLNIQGIDFPGVGTSAFLWGFEIPKILIMKRGQKCRHEKGKWSFPGGGLEHGESLIDSLRREVKEELGIEIFVPQNMGAYYFAEDMIQENDVLHHWVTLCYVCYATSNDIQNLEGTDKCEAMEWIDPLEEGLFDKYEFSAFTRQVLTAFRNENFIEDGNA